MTAAILNQGSGSWAFEEHAAKLAAVLWLDVTSEPQEFNYLLCWEQPEPPAGRLFIPWEAIQVASDKRLQAAAFARNGVATPKTFLVDTVEELQKVLAREGRREWVLKYPVSCGGTGHQKITVNSLIREDWPRPFVLQEFIPMEQPEVYRLYGVAGDVFGWNARRFPSGVKPSPWVAHARGARYVHLGEPPEPAAAAARAALAATDLLGSFGAVDLLRRGDDWLVLEVGTDGVFNHVDRDFDSQALEEELNRRLAEAFWSRVGSGPWGDFGWKPRPKAEAVA